MTLTLTAAASAAPGTATLTVRGVPQAPSAGAQSHTTTLDVVVQGQLAAYVKGIEVTQGVQTVAQPALTPYRGVELVGSKRTVVRVYAGFLGTEAGGTRPEIGMSLTGMDAGGRFLPGATLLPDWSPPPSSLSLNAKFIGTEERGSASQAFVFTLPENWTTRGSIALRAQVLAAEPPSPFNRPEVAGATVCIETACGATPTRDLNRIGFRAAPAAQAISALEQRFAAVSPSGKALPDILPLDAVRTFAALMQISPVPFTFLDAAGNASPIPRYRAVSYPPAKQIWENADAFDMSIGRPGHSTFGAFNSSSDAGVSFSLRTSVGTSDPTPDGRVDRPLTVIAHEVVHTFSIGHADQLKADGGCGGGGGGFPTPTGRLNSVGIDTNFLSGGGVGSPPYRMIADTAAVPAYDLMSYCATLGGGDPDSWISAQTWNQMLGAAPLSYRVLRRARAVASAVGPVLHVRAEARDGAVTVGSVRRMSAAAPGSARSDYVLVARDAEGRSLASVPMTVTEVRREGVPGFLRARRRRGRRGGGLGRGQHRRQCGGGPHRQCPSAQGGVHRAAAGRSHRRRLHRGRELRALRTPTATPSPLSSRTRPTAGGRSAWCTAAPPHAVPRYPQPSWRRRRADGCDCASATASTRPRCSHARSWWRPVDPRSRSSRRWLGSGSRPDRRSTSAEAPSTPPAGPSPAETSAGTRTAHRWAAARRSARSCPRARSASGSRPPTAPVAPGRRRPR